jgi:Glycosyl transferases group 1
MPAPAPLLLKPWIKYVHIAKQWAWQLDRWRSQIKSLEALASSDANTLLIGVRHELAEAQFYPFYFHRSALRHTLGLRFGEMSMDDWEQCPPSTPQPGVSAVFYQCPFDASHEKLTQHLTRLRSTFPKARIVFMDWFAPIDIRYAPIVSPWVDAYIKKQVFAEPTQFLQPTLGDTNLTDFYARKFGLNEPLQDKPIDAAFLPKVHIGNNFGLSRKISPFFLRAKPMSQHRGIDLHARIAVKGTPWYQGMRQEAFDAVAALPPQVSVVRDGRVSNVEFFCELLNSKLCFSPFGYGEVCWRDYEALACGSLLLKPEVSHLRVTPDIYQPFATYVPLAWDFSDLGKMVAHYLSNEQERQAIVDAGFQTMREWIVKERFVEDVRRWLSPATQA